MSAATARAGGEQAGYGEIICRAIDRASASIEFEKLRISFSNFFFKQLASLSVSGAL